MSCCRAFARTDVRGIGAEDAHLEENLGSTDQYSSFEPILSF
jgi:hypothetical protein